VVQVKVESPDDPNNPGQSVAPFVTSEQSVDRGNLTAKDKPAPSALFDGKVVATPLKQLGSTDGWNQEPIGTGIAYQAKVTLIGVGNDQKTGVNKIVVGFEQYAQFTTMKLTFADGKTYVATLASTKDEKTYNTTKWYLDSADTPGKKLQSWPFVSRAPAALFGGNQQSQKTIANADWPYFNIPLKSPDNSLLKEVAFKWSFQLAVVAQTTQAQKDSDGAYILNREATANWSWDASGTITADPKGNDSGISWTGATNAQGATTAVVSAPNPNQWTIPTVVSQDKPDDKLLYFNQLIDYVTWKS
jgi:hypothetical protein